MAEYLTGEKDGIAVEEYNGKWSLVAMYNGYKQWAKYKIGRDAYKEKDLPVKVTLGNRDKAIEVLTAILAVIRGGENVDGEDAPF
jgi:hypothetical protein